MKKQIMSFILIVTMTVAVVPPVFASDEGKIMQTNNVSVGDGFTAVIDADGSLWTCGDNNYGQLGNGTTEDSNVLVKIMEDVITVSCGGEHMAAIKSDGSLWTWGHNKLDQCQ